MAGGTQDEKRCRLGVLEWFEVPFIMHVWSTLGILASEDHVLPIVPVAAFRQGAFTPSPTSQPACRFDIHGRVEVDGRSSTR